jgi:hypothetical protein
MQLVFNSFGEKIRESELNASAAIVQSTTHRFDDFGNKTETLIVKTAEPEKFIKSKTILEFYTDQVTSAKTK